MILSRADSHEENQLDQLIPKNLIRTVLNKLQEFPGETISEEEAKTLLRPLLKIDRDFINEDL